MVMINIGLQANNLCALRSKNRRSFNAQTLSNNLLCENKNCEGKLSYKCGTNHCSINKKLCDDFFKLREKNEEKFKRKFKTSIVKDICINGKDCFHKKITPMRSRTNHKSLKKIDCPCIKNHAFICGKSHCAANGLACFKFLARNSSATILNGCGNDNIII